jgi:hypothetical protein
MVKTSKSARILDLIEASGGMRLIDIQRALWKMSHRVPFTREQRGYWCTALLGGPHYHRGLLRAFCEKDEKGLWHRNEVPHLGQPWKALRLMDGCPNGFFHPYNRCTCGE